MSILAVTQNDIGRVIVDRDDNSEYKITRVDLVSVLAVRETHLYNLTHSKIPITDFHKFYFKYEGSDITNTQNQRKVAAKQLRDAYDKCRGLDMGVFVDEVDLGLYITYDAPVEDY